jgi:hypothetical protein
VRRPVESGVSANGSIRTYRPCGKRPVHPVRLSVRRYQRSPPPYAIRSRRTGYGAAKRVPYVAGEVSEASVSGHSVARHPTVSRPSRVRFIPRRFRAVRWLLISASLNRPPRGFPEVVLALRPAVSTGPCVPCVKGPGVIALTLSGPPDYRPPGPVVVPFLRFPVRHLGSARRVGCGCKHPRER